MSFKFYECFCLKKFEQNTLFYVRLEENKEKLYKYYDILQNIHYILQELKERNIDQNVGIALNMTENTVESCVLLLSILNYNCYFYQFDYMKAKNFCVDLRLSGVSYIFSQIPFNYDNHNEVDFTSWYKIKPIIILNKKYLLVKVNFETVKLYQDVCYVIATSGTTSDPKMVFVPYKCIAPNIISLCNLLQLQVNDLIYLGTPPTFDPFVVEFFLALKVGASLLLTSSSLHLFPSRLLQIMGLMHSQQRGVTFIQMTPSIFRLFGPSTIRNMILHKHSSLRCKEFSLYMNFKFIEAILHRYLLLGGEAFPTYKEMCTWLPIEKNQPIHEKFGKRIFNIYGITEISCWSLCYEYIHTRHKDNERIPLGNPLDEAVFTRILDENGENSMKGILEIGSNSRHCYIPQLDNPVDNVNDFKVIFRSTGDLVERNSLGDIYYLGRSDSTIKRYGNRLSLDTLTEKIENILNTKDFLFRAVCLWEPKSLLLILCLMTDKSEFFETEKNYHNRKLEINLENYEYPDIITYLNEVPLTKHGKLDRAKLLKSVKHKQLKTPHGIFMEFLNTKLGFTENLIDDKLTLSTQEEGAKRRRFDIDTNFLQAGGTSFQALSLSTEISELMKNGSDQRQMLEFLLDSKTSLRDILVFLTKVESNCSENTRCKDIDYKMTDVKGNNILTSNLAESNLKFLWRLDLQKCIDTSPSICKNHNIVAVGSHSYLLMVADASNGNVISKIYLPNRIECPVVFLNYPLASVGCYDGNLYTVNIRTGLIEWHVDIGGMIKAKPLLLKEDDLLILASYSKVKNVKALCINTKTTRWDLMIGSKGILSSPLKISSNLILISTLDGTYAMVQSNNGFIKWWKQLQSPIFSTGIVIIFDNQTYFALAEVRGQISVCTIKNGDILTSYQAEGNIFSGLTLSHNCVSNTMLIIFGCYDKHIYGLNFSKISLSLSLSWKLSVMAPIYATPLLIDNNEMKNLLLTCTTNGIINVWDLNKLCTLDRYDVKAEIFSSPSCFFLDQKDSRIFVGSRDNFLYAFNFSIRN